MGKLHNTTFCTLWIRPFSNLG